MKTQPNSRTTELETKRVQICLPDNTHVMLPPGCTVADLAQMRGCRSTVLVARADNRLVDLSYCFTRDVSVELMGLDAPDGWRAYRRSLSLVLVAAMRRCHPDYRLTIEHSIGECLFCKVRELSHVSKQLIEALRASMQELVEEDLPFERLALAASEAECLFARQGTPAKQALVRQRGDDKVVVYRLGEEYDLGPGPMVSSTGSLTLFGLDPYPPGLLLRLPDPHSTTRLGRPGPRRKLFRILYEYEKWGEILGMETVADLNDIIRQKEELPIVRVSEALHEKKISQIADQIVETVPLPRVVLIAGPSSSGKTTFSRRLAVQLRVLGLVPHTVSIDDYFRNREDTPRDDSGEYDFESPQAIDVDLLNANINDLLDGHGVHMPHFDFLSGSRQGGRDLRIGPDHLLVIEGIHGLNDELFASVWPHLRYKIYVSALTQLSLDDHNAIHTSDTRLIRRLVRDFRKRGYSAEETILRWPSVRRGEERNIFPFQESSDAMFNSALVYELHVLRTPAVELLGAVPRTSPAYAEAHRLLGLLAFFDSMAPVHVPRASILQEFLGSPMV